MAWRPYQNLIEGELDNSKPGIVTGWIKFVGMKKRVILDLLGDFHQDIVGAVIRITNPKPSDRNRELDRPGTYMEGFSHIQRGEVGDITAGLPPQPYVNYPYIEWYSKLNGRVVLELDSEQLEIIKQPA